MPVSAPSTSSLLAVLAFATAACGAAPRPAPQTHASAGWTELTVVWTYGPCPADARSCHQELHVRPSGHAVTVETPSAPAAALSKERDLTPDELSRLRDVVETAAFADGMARGFPCAAPSYDATITLVLRDASSTLTQDVTLCVRGSGDAPNAPRSVVQLLERYRFASR
jgi:hypothetical protein